MDPSRKVKLGSYYLATFTHKGLREKIFFTDVGVEASEHFMARV